MKKTTLTSISLFKAEELAEDEANAMLPGMHRMHQSLVELPLGGPGSSVAVRDHQTVPSRYDSRYLYNQEPTPPRPPLPPELETGTLFFLLLLS